MSDSDRRYDLLRREPQGLTLNELVELVRSLHTGDPVPPCPVCAGALSIARAGGGEPTVWACSGQEADPARPGYLRRLPGRGVADEHYSRSRFVQRR